MLCFKNIKKSFMSISDSHTWTEPLERVLFSFLLPSQSSGKAAWDVMGRVPKSLTIMITVFSLQYISFTYPRDIE